MVKLAKIGQYGPKTRALQRRLSYEKVSQTHKFADVWMYLGSRVNDDPSISDIQSTTFMEVPDRAYAAVPVRINIDFDPFPEQQTDLSQFGIVDPTGDDQKIRVHINSYEDLGRPIVEGDVMMVDFFNTEDVDAYWEVKDVDRKHEFEKYYAIITLDQLADSRATREIDMNGSNAGILGEIDNWQQIEQEEVVPFDGLDGRDIDNGEPGGDDEPEPYDGRNKTQRSFLDDLDGDLL